MNRIRSFFSNSFGSALLGGLVVGLLGWIAIAAGWIEGPRESSLAPVPLTQPVAGEGRDGKALSVNEIYDRSSAGVAHIEATGIAAPVSPLSPFGPPQRQSSTGSGFVIDEQGRIVTNAHVVEGAQKVTVTLSEDGDEYDAELAGVDRSTDIAVLEIDASEDELEPLPLGDSSALDVGDPVVAIGNPFGLDRTVTAGIVSALQREIRAPDGFTIRDVIQTDAPINPGNSGGPLIDATGGVVGVNSQIQSTGGGNVGIGFAVPIDTVREIARELIAEGEVEHAFMGITGADLTEEIAELLKLEERSGALVQSVQSGSPADDAGLEAGDVVVNVDGERIRVGGDLIVAVDGERVVGMDDVIAAIQSREPGDDVELTVERDGEERQVKVTLEARPGDTSG